jgi:hypothetical protein
MTLKGVLAFTMIAIVGLGVQVEAQTPCPELVRLRNAATEAWKQAMRAPPSERCGALYRAALAAEATLKYADNNRESCDITVPLLNQVERYHRGNHRITAFCGLQEMPAETLEKRGLQKPAQEQELWIGMHSRGEVPLRRTTEAMAFIQKMTLSHSGSASRDVQQSFEEAWDEWSAMQAVVKLELCCSRPKAC